MSRDTAAQDIAIGARIRERRILCGMTQEQLGEQLEISAQQVMKYEKGMNRVAGGRLQAAARALACSVLDLMGGDEIDDPRQRETTIFVRNYLALPALQQRAVRRLVETLSAGSR